VSVPAGDEAPAKSASSALRRGGGEISCYWQECRTNKKALRPKPEGRPAPLSERRFSGHVSSFHAGRRGDFRFRAAEPADGVGAHAPEDSDLRGLGFLGLAVLAVVLRADEHAVHEDVIALMERAGQRLAEAVEGHDAVPLGARLPLVVRVFPRLLRRDGEDGEAGAVTADLPLLRILSQEADELDVIDYVE
jgi:hypothetical protein